MKLLEKFSIKDMTLKNRVVMEPMCMYSATKHDGIATHFHFAHYVARAIGQVGLIIIEATGVVPEGRITDDCLGLYDDSQIEPLKKIVEAVHQEGSKIAIQLNHAGRKCKAVDGVDTIYGPSAIAYSDTYRTPKEMTQEDINSVIKAFQDAAVRAKQIGFDAIEIHGAHGYLISEFMSPITNKRSDKYKDGAVFIREVAEAIREVWPMEKPLLIRVSATDYEDGGQSVDDAIRMLEPSLDLIDIVNVSSGGITVNPPKSIYPGYQVDFATRIKEKLDVPVIACGLLGNLDLVSFILETEKADLVGLARPLLSNPNWLLQSAQSRRKMDVIPYQYERGFK